MHAIIFFCQSFLLVNTLYFDKHYLVFNSAELIKMSCSNKPMQFSGLKIHISEATMSILETLGGFVIKERGEVYLKVSDWKKLLFLFSFYPRSEQKVFL